MERRKPDLQIEMKEYDIDYKCLECNNPGQINVSVNGKGNSFPDIICETCGGNTKITRILVLPRSRS